ncbi:hypothetical protein [Rhizobium sp. Leaf386]|uniref:hypothetical protein n=1 Tax=Rhizobium sp. Leaf386 TaxID=1736359 RepID=UPI0012E120AF|nr:hypothetical protein [Rhizobium sp. Leaf386]
MAVPKANHLAGLSPWLSISGLKTPLDLPKIRAAQKYFCLSPLVENAGFSALSVAELSRKKRGKLRE